MPIPVNWVEPVSWVQFEEDFVKNRTKGQTKFGRSREVIMRLMIEFGPPPLDCSSLDLGLTDEELSIRNKVREFAKEILRPAGVKMDKLPSSETAKPSSPWHSAYQGYKDLGLDDEALFFSDDRVASNRLKAIVWEELGWGDAGLAVTLMLTHLPDFFARSIGRMDLAEEFAGKTGRCACLQGLLPHRSGCRYT